MCVTSSLPRALCSCGHANLLLTEHTLSLLLHTCTGCAGERIVDASIALHKAVAEKFLPSAVKFCYNWNMRELSAIFNGECTCCNAYMYLHARASCMCQLL